MLLRLVGAVFGLHLPFADAVGTSVANTVRVQQKRSTRLARRQQRAESYGKMAETGGVRTTFWLASQCVPQAARCIEFDQVRRGAMCKTCMPILLRGEWHAEHSRSDEDDGDGRWYDTDDGCGWMDVCLPWHGMGRRRMVLVFLQ